MNNFLDSIYRRRLLATCFGLCCTSPLMAQPFPFAGQWLMDDPVDAQAAYTTLTIKDTSMSWSGPKQSVPPCVREFELKNEKPGTVYTDSHGTKFVAGAPGSLPSYLLKVSAGACGSVSEEVRIRYPLVYDVTHIEVIEYVSGKPVSSRRLHRKKSGRTRKR